jgi:hypothetical protein
MISENMRLETKRDAQQWAASFNLPDDQEERLASWIWRTKPFIGCTKSDHPIYHITTREFWSIVDPQEDDK